MRGDRSAGDESVQHKETVMGVCRMLVILLYCVSSHAALCPPTDVSNGQLKFYYIPEQTNISVFVPCPNVPTAKVKTFKLFKDQTNIHSCTLDRGQTGSCMDPLHGSNLDVQFVNKGKLLGFTANVTSRALYTCETYTLAPPPYKTLPYEQMVIVHTGGCLCQCNETNITGTVVKTDEDRSQMFTWIWLTVVALLSTYCLAVTSVALIFWCKLKSVDNQSDYMNTKPKPARQRKNKNKFQNPIPRYF